MKMTKQIIPFLGSRDNIFDIGLISDFVLGIVKRFFLTGKWDDNTEDIMFLISSKHVFLSKLILDWLSFKKIDLSMGVSIVELLVCSTSMGPMLSM